jgi:hypothetical protein
MALLLQMQRTHGNRAVQQLLSTSARLVAMSDAIRPEEMAPIGLPSALPPSADMVSRDDDLRSRAAPANGAVTFIQRAKIDHRTVTWDDYLAKVPKGATFEAETATGFADPNLPSLMPATPTGTDTGEDCKIGKKKETKFKVDITIDPASPKVKSFMSQDDSWHKGWTTDEDTRKKKCLAEVSPKCEKGFDSEFAKIKGERTKAEAECRKNFDDASKDANRQCKGLEADCKAAFKSGQASFSITVGTLTITANSAKECTTVLLKDCVKEMMKGFKVTNTVGSGTATATTRAECGKPFGEDLEKLMKDAVTVDMNSSVKVTSRDDCRQAFLEPCSKVLMQARADALLRHEQAHFDLTDALAQKAERDLRALVGTFPTEVEACGKSAAEAKAKATLASELAKMKKQFAASEKELNDFHKKYDAETKHGVAAEKQSAWEASISKGF